MENSSLFQRFLSHSSQEPSVSEEEKLDAVECFASRTFSCVPAQWIAEMQAHRGLQFALPMCLTLFLIDEDWAARKIARYLSEYDFGEDVERQRLIDCGWRVVCTTGLFAIEIDGLMLLGVDGIGYDFFESHWEPLYDLLGLRWHLDD